MTVSLHDTKWEERQWQGKWERSDVGETKCCKVMRDGGSKLLSKVDPHLPDYMVQHKYNII